MCTRLSIGLMLWMVTSPLLGQEPAADGLQIADYRVGPVLVTADRTSLFFGASYELSKFDAEIQSLVSATSVGPRVDVGIESDRFGAFVGFTWGRFFLEGHAGVVNAYPDVESDADYGGFGGARVGLQIAQVDRLAVGADFGVSGNRAAYSVTGTDPSSGDELTLDVDLSWVQYDARLAVAYAPSASAGMALSPYFGVGYRGIDGVLDFGASLPGVSGLEAAEPEADATLFYGLFGLAYQARLGSGGALRAELGGMVGELSGLSLTFSATF